jgi:hypothetical protein
VGGRGGRGPPYEVVARLYGIADDEWWAFDGWCAAHGVDPFRLPISRQCNLIYSWCLERIQDREKFDTMLSAPIPGVSRNVADRVDTRRETQNVLALGAWAAGVQGG